MILYYFFILYLIFNYFSFLINIYAIISPVLPITRLNKEITGNFICSREIKALVYIKNGIISTMENNYQG